MPQVLVPHSVVPRLLSRLLSHLDESNSRWIIGLAGLPGAGKSTFAARWVDEVNAEVSARSVARLAPPVAMALGMDGFHFSLEQLRARPDAEEALARRGAPWTFDAWALATRLRGLRDFPSDVGWPGFEHEVGDPIENAISVAPSVRLIVIEGLYLLHREDGWDEVSDLLDERWFLDTPLETAMSRLLTRHMKAWGLSREQALARIEANDGLNARTVQASRNHADFLVAP